MENLTQSQVENAKNLACEKCNTQVLKQVFVIKVISGLITGQSKDTLVPVPLFACNSCGHVNSMFTKELNMDDKPKLEL